MSVTTYRTNLVSNDTLPADTERVLLISPYVIDMRYDVHCITSLKLINEQGNNLVDTPILDLKYLPDLRDVVVNYLDFEKIIFHEDNISIEKLDVLGCSNLRELIVHDKNSPRVIKIGRTSINSIPNVKLHNLEKLNLNKLSISNVDLTKCANLEKLFLLNARIEKLSLDGRYEIPELYIDHDTAINIISTKHQPIDALLEDFRGVPGFRLTLIHGHGWVFKAENTNSASSASSSEVYTLSQ